MWLCADPFRVQEIVGLSVVCSILPTCPSLGIGVLEVCVCVLALEMLLLWYPPHLVYPLTRDGCPFTSAVEVCVCVGVEILNCPPHTPPLVPASVQLSDVVWNNYMVWK